MSDLISRQSAIDIIKNRYGKYSNITWIDRAMLIEELKDLPPAQPVQQEQKTALWIIRKWGDDAQCSNCGRYFKDVYDLDNYDNYCRHCGSNMKGLTIGKID